MTTLTDWLDETQDRIDAAETRRADLAERKLADLARTNLPKALDGLRTVLDPSTARRIVAMSHQITPEELAPEDLWLVQEVEQIIAATVATALGVQP
jgi:hypothetical protein